MGSPACCACATTSSDWYVAKTTVHRFGSVGGALAIARPAGPSRSSPGSPGRRPEESSLALPTLVSEHTAKVRSGSVASVDHSLSDWLSSRRCSRARGRAPARRVATTSSARRRLVKVLPVPHAMISLPAVRARPVPARTASMAVRWCGRSFCLVGRGSTGPRGGSGRRRPSRASRPTRSFEPDDVGPGSAGPRSRPRRAELSRPAVVTRRREQNGCLPDSARKESISPLGRAAEFGSKNLHCTATRSPVSRSRATRSMPWSGRTAALGPVAPHPHLLEAPGIQRLGDEEGLDEPLEPGALVPGVVVRVVQLVQHVVDVDPPRLRRSRAHPRQRGPAWMVERGARGPDVGVGRVPLLTICRSGCGPGGYPSVMADVIADPELDPAATYAVDPARVRALTARVIASGG
jgi:hypothetical protein